MSRVIDAHVQIWDPWSAELEFDADGGPVPTMSVEQLLREAHQAGVDHVMQVTPLWMGFDNRYAEEGARRHPGEIAIFARIDAEREDLEEELASWSRDPAIAGIHISAAAGQPRIDDMRYERLLDGCAAIGLPVAVDAPGGTDAIARVAREHPHVRLLVDHAGMREGMLEPDDWSSLLDLGVHPNVSVKLSLLPQAARQRRQGAAVARAVQALVWSFGSHRLLWGSNFPACRSVCSYEEAVDVIVGCRTLWEGDKELILGGNWSRMFEAVLV